jgi:hypothetical protein
MAIWTRKDRFGPWEPSIGTQLGREGYMKRKISRGKVKRTKILFRSKILLKSFLHKNDFIVSICSMYGPILPHFIFFPVSTNKKLLYHTRIKNTEFCASHAIREDIF